MQTQLKRLEDMDWFLVVPAVLLVDLVVITIWLLLHWHRLPRRWFGRAEIVPPEAAKKLRRSFGNKES